MTSFLFFFWMVVFNIYFLPTFQHVTIILIQFPKILFPTPLHLIFIANLFTSAYLGKFNFQSQLHFNSFIDSKNMKVEPN